jgi:ubiquinone/menaquinone biosynthesis C-methylase UbiE
VDKPMPNVGFKFMSFAFKVRDFFLPRKYVLEEVGLQQGFHVLDFGCGPGSYSVIASELVGQTGKVYALDIHPLAIQQMQNTVSKKKLTNLQTICSDCLTDLLNSSIDVVLLYDTFHHLSNPDLVLEELYRILKTNGILSFSDHHMKEENILSHLTNKGLFKLSRKGRKTYSFSKK